MNLCCQIFIYNGTKWLKGKQILDSIAKNWYIIVCQYEYGKKYFYLLYIIFRFASRSWRNHTKPIGGFDWCANEPQKARYKFLTDGISKLSKKIRFLNTQKISFWIVVSQIGFLIL